MFLWMGFNGSIGKGFNPRPVKKHGFNPCPGKTIFIFFLFIFFYSNTNKDKNFWFSVLEWK